VILTPRARLKRGTSGASGTGRGGGRGGAAMVEFVDAGEGARIKVVGVGGGGGNAVNTMIAAGLPGVDFIAANTDAQALRANLSRIKMLLGEELTRGLGAGGDQEGGKRAAHVDVERLRVLLDVV